MNEHEFEPVPGLPEDLPAGEVILWQGAPDWRVLARRALHLRLLVGYFVLLVLVRLGSARWAGSELAVAFESVTVLAALGLCATGLFLLYAWLIARTTLYTITNRRLVMRFGLALPMSINLPFAHIKAAAVRRFPRGYGDLPLQLDHSHRVSWMVMWPHVRPWQFRRPQPMLRCIADVMAVAELVAEIASSTPAPAASRHHTTELPTDRSPAPAVAIGEAT